VIVIDEHDGSRTVELTDASGTVVDVEAGPPFTGELVGDVAATNDPADPSRVHVTWEFNSCSTPATLTIDATGTELRLEPSFCDPMDALGGNPLQITLVFAGPVDASTLNVELVETP
jgi:hypothetical protein